MQNILSFRISIGKLAFVKNRRKKCSSPIFQTTGPVLRIQGKSPPPPCKKAVFRNVCNNFLQTETSFYRGSLHKANIFHREVSAFRTKDNVYFAEKASL